MNYLEFCYHLLPEILVLLTALALIGLGCTGDRSSATPSSWAMTAIASVGLAGAIAALIWGSLAVRLFDGMLVIDPLTRLFKGILLGMTLVVVGFLHDSRGDNGAEASGRAENLALLLFSALGLMVVVGTEELLVLFLGLELASLAFYVLVSFSQSDARSAEAGWKYFFFGSVAAAFLLFGLSFIFGATGSGDLRVIGGSLRIQSAEPILLVGLAFALMGFGFKVAAVPFHLWAPDVYAGAPPPAAAFIASGSKVAGFFILGKVLLLGFVGVEGSAGWGGFASGWAPLIAVLAALSMVVGNLAALAQTSVRRLLAYSGIGQAGFILATLVAAGKETLPAILFYSVIYGIATLGAFGVVGVVLRFRGGDRLADFAGLGRESPVLSSAMALCLISLAGLPPLAGFFGKFYLFTATMRGPGLLWLVVLALFMSAVSLYYYLGIVKQMFIEQPPATATKVVPSLLQSALCVALGLSLIVLGCFPNLLLGPLAMVLRDAL